MDNAKEAASFVKTEKNGCLIDVYVTPGAWKTVFLGVRDDGRLKVALNAPAEDGKANKELLRLFKRSFGECKLKTGAKSRKKIVYLKTTTAEEVAERILNDI